MHFWFKLFVFISDNMRDHWSAISEFCGHVRFVADVFSSYFQSITDSLDLFEWHLDQIYDSVDRIIGSFRYHPSITNIKRNLKLTGKFSVKPVSEELVKDIISDLSSNKAAGGEFPLKILKECDFSFHFLTNCIKKQEKRKISRLFKFIWRSACP